MAHHLHRANLVSTAYSGTTTLPINRNRSYFMVVMTTGTSTVEFGGGGGLLPLAAAAFYEPTVAPTSEVTITTSGTFVVIEG